MITYNINCKRSEKGFCVWRREPFQTREKEFFYLKSKTDIPCYRF